MKKILTVILCLAMLFALAACSEEAQNETADTTAHNHEEVNTTAFSEAPEASESEEISNEHDHTHINYRGRETIFTAEDLVQIEGRECDFTYEQNENTIYIYNGLEIDGMKFTQTQFSFSDANVRVSCTYTANKGTEENPVAAEDIQSETETMLATYEAALNALYGDGAVGEQHGQTTTTWSDHSGNYIILTRINDTTVQVAYYICAQGE